MSDSTVFNNGVHIDPERPADGKSAGLSYLYQLKP